MIKEIGVGTAHSKIILMGEHSVVYGYPAISLPLNNIEVTERIPAGTPEKHQDQRRILPVDEERQITRVSMTSHEARRPNRLPARHHKRPRRP